MFCTPPLLTNLFLFVRFNFAIFQVSIIQVFQNRNSLVSLSRNSSQTELMLESGLEVILNESILELQS